MSNCWSVLCGGREGLNMNECNGEVKCLVFLEVVNLVLYWVMVEDEMVVVLGEDVGVNGGVFCVIFGLCECFGFKWVLDMLLVENMIVGLFIGMVV